MAKTERGISIMVFIRLTSQEIWDMEEAELEKQRINHITPEIPDFFRKTTPISNFIQHRRSSSVNLFLVPEIIVWNDGATQKGCGHGKS